MYDNKMAQLKVKNSAQTTFRFSPISFRAPGWYLEEAVLHAGHQVLMEVDLYVINLVHFTKKTFNNVTYKLFPCFD